MAPHSNRTAWECQKVMVLPSQQSQVNMQRRCYGFSQIPSNAGEPILSTSPSSVGQKHRQERPCVTYPTGFVYTSDGERIMKAAHSSEGLEIGATAHIVVAECSGINLRDHCNLESDDLRSRMVHTLGK